MEPIAILDSIEYKDNGEKFNNLTQSLIVLEKEAIN